MLTRDAIHVMDNPPTARTRSVWQRLVSACTALRQRSRGHRLMQDSAHRDTLVIAVGEILACDAVVTAVGRRDMTHAFDVHTFQRHSNTWKLVCHRFSSNDAGVCKQWISAISSLIDAGSVVLNKRELFGLKLGFLFQKSGGRDVCWSSSTHTRVAGRPRTCSTRRHTCTDWAVCGWTLC